MEKMMSLEIAKKILRRLIDYSRKIEKPCSIAITDELGFLIFLE